MKSIEKIKMLFTAVATCFKDFKPLCESSSLLIEDAVEVGAPVVEQVENGTFRPAPDQEITTAEGIKIKIEGGIITEIEAPTAAEPEAAVEAEYECGKKDECAEAAPEPEPEPEPEPAPPTFSVSEEDWNVIKAEIESLKAQVNALAPKVDATAADDSEKASYSKADAYRHILGRLSTL